MSNYRARAFNPISKKIEDADFLDNHFGHHIYAVRFNDGTIAHTYECDMDAAAAELDRLGALYLQSQTDLQNAIGDRDEAHKQQVLAESRASRIERETIERCAGWHDEQAQIAQRCISRHDGEGAWIKWRDKRDAHRYAAKCIRQLAPATTDGKGK